VELIKDQERPIRKRGIKIKSAYQAKFKVFDETAEHFSHSSSRI